MAKCKTGLHKGISTIFDGVPLAENGVTTRQYHMAPTDRIGYVPAQSSIQSADIYSPQQPVQQQVNPTKATTLNVAVMAQTIWRWFNGKIAASEPGVSAARQKVMFMLVAVLFGIFIYVFAPLLKNPKSKTIASIKPSQAISVAKSNSKIEWQIPPAYPKKLRDPMQIGLATAAYNNAGGLVIKGIVYSEDNPSVIIGKQILHKGEQAYGATILNISKNSVTFEINGKTWTQKVGS